MTDFTRDFLHFSSVLLIMGVVAALILSPVYQKTHPIITKLEEEKSKSALKELFPDIKSSIEIEVSEKIVKVVKDKNKLILGYAFEVITLGYGGPIVIFVGMDPSGYLKGIKIISHSETPGLGAKIVEIKKDKYIWEIFSPSKKVEKESQIPWFQKQFTGQYVPSMFLARGKQSDGIQAITGATITSRSVMNVVKETCNKIMKEINNKKIEELLIHKGKMFKKWKSGSVNVGEDSEYYDE